ncbi:MAG: hypothetical protein K2W96_27915 [Gemmataceae bacterium]|nr:hypothetical protein [Gemmataceae bacterium]
MSRYERDLRIPYCLIYSREAMELSLYRLRRRRYSAVVPDEDGRCEIAEIESSVGLLDGWVRYWHRGELVPLPDELDAELEAARVAQADAVSERDAERRQRRQTQRERDEARRQRDEAQRQRDALQAEVERLRALLPPGG